MAQEPAARAPRDDRSGIQLVFHGWSAAQRVALGPAPWFRVAGNFIREGPAGEIVAALRNHQWVLKDQHFTRFECAQPVVLHFEDAAGGASPPLGPYGAISVADGALYAGEKLVAKFVEETQLWHCFPTENFWPVVVLSPASA